MINYLKSIHGEIKNVYDNVLKLNKQNDLLNNDIYNILNFYILKVYIYGKNTTRIKLNLDKINDLSNEDSKRILELAGDNQSGFICELNKSIINAIEQSKGDPECLSDVMYVICQLLIYVFRQAQIDEFINNDVMDVYINTDDDSCPMCNTMSKFNLNINMLKNHISPLHSYCKIEILPIKFDMGVDFDINGIEFINCPKTIKNEIRSIIKKIKLNKIKLIENKTIEFCNEITEHSYFLNNMQNMNDEKLNNSSSKISYFNFESKTLIDIKHLKDLEYLIIKSIIDINIDDYENQLGEIYEKVCNENYIGLDLNIKKHPFISYSSQLTLKNFIIENVIYYIINPNKIKDINLDLFNIITNIMYKN